MRILIIEDKKILSDIIKERLEKEHFVVDATYDGEDGYYYAATGVYDLIILDIMLPGIDGFQILSDLRKNKVESKIIILSAKSSINDKLEGLKNGADDYMTKPFHMDELLARINLQIKDKNLEKGLLEFGDIILDVNNSYLKCIKSEESVELVLKEMQIMEYFINNPNHLLTKEQIYDRVWGVENTIESNNLEVYLTFIRKKIKAIGSNVLIKSLRGMGYKLIYNNE